MVLNKIFCIILMSIFFDLTAQTINVKTIGAHGDGKTNDAPAINKILKGIKAKNPKEKALFNPKTTLYFPAGTYILDEPLQIPELVDLEGETNSASILKVIRGNSGAIILLNEKDDNLHHEDNYTHIKNISIIGPEFDKRPFVWKDLSKNNENSFGIKILAYRNRIENCVISGFLGSGIHISSSYYNYITSNYILNNRIGIDINNTSTTAYIQNNEFIYNGIGITVQGNSFGNFVSNNILESNISNLLPNFNSEQDSESLKRGIGVALKNSHWNTVQNNYFEQQFINISFDSSDENLIINNFFAIGELMPYANSGSQMVMKFFSLSKSNTVNQNIVAAPNQKIDRFNIVILDPLKDYSSNTINFGRENNDNILLKLQKKYGNKGIPKIEN